VAYDDNRHLYVKNTDRDVVVTNGTEDKNNTFAMNTFGMWYVDGIVTANSYTLDSLSETTNNAPRTNVVFDAATDMGQGAVASYPFEYTTGLDMIGHAARTYYSIERRAPVVYAIVDRATKVEYISYNANTTNLANAANDAGFRRNTILSIPTNDYKVNYSWTDTVGSLNTNVNQWDDGEVNLTGPHINKTLIAISNSSDYQVDYVIVLDQYLDTVKRAVETTNGGMDYDLTTGDGNDQNIAHGTFSTGDYVIVTDVGNQGRMLNLTAPEKVTASISKITGVSDGEGTVKSVIADGTTYNGSPVAHHESGKQVVNNSTRTLDNTTNFESIQTIGETTLLLDFQGKCIGIAEPETVTNYAYAAQFGVLHTGSSLNTEYTLTVKLHFIDGTSGVYKVNTSAGSYATNTFKGLDMTISEDNARDIADMLNKGVVSASGTYPYADNSAVYDPHDNYTNGLVVGDGSPTGISGAKGQLYLNGVAGTPSDNTTGLGIYKVSLRGDDSVVLKTLAIEETANADQPGVRLIPGHSTLVRADGQNVKQSNGRDMYQTSKTAYFYVDGCRTDADNKPNTTGKTYAYSSSLSVGVKTGLSNAVGITRGGNKDENNNYETFEQVFVTPAQDAKDRDVISAILVYGYDMGSSDTMYFYKEGSYHLTDKSGVEVASRANTENIAITYDMYDANGELYQAVYNNGGKYYDIETATDMVDDHATGYYKLGKDDVEEQYTITDRVNHGTDQKLTDNNNLVDGAKNIYVLNAEAKHDEFEENFYTSVDAVAGITANTLVVDTTGNNIDSITDIARHCIAGDTVRVSYTYKTTGDDAYKVKVVFVTSFSPKGQNSGDNVVGSTQWASYSGNTFTVRYHAVDRPLTKSYVEDEIRKLTGESNVDANLVMGTVRVGENANWIFGNYTLKTIEMVSVAYSGSKVYVDKKTASANASTNLTAAGLKNLGTDGTVVYAIDGKVVESGDISYANNAWSIKDSLLTQDVVLRKGAVVKMTVMNNSTGAIENAGQTPGSFEVKYNTVKVELNNIVPVGANLVIQSKLEGAIADAENYIITVSEDGNSRGWDSTYNGHRGSKAITMNHTISSGTAEVTIGWEWGMIFKVANATVSYGETPETMTQKITSAGQDTPAYAILRMGWSWRLDNSFDQYHWASPGLMDKDDIDADQIYKGMYPNQVTFVNFSNPTDDPPVYNGPAQGMTLYGGLTKIGQATTTRADATLEAVKTALTSMGVTVIANSDSSELFAFGEDTIEKAENAPADATGFAIVVNGENKFVPYGTSIQEIAALCGNKGEITFPQSLMMTAKPGTDGAPEAVAPSGGTGDGGAGGGSGDGTGDGGNVGGTGGGTSDGGNGGGTGNDTGNGGTGGDNAGGGSSEGTEGNNEQTNDNQTNA